MNSRYDRYFTLKYVAVCRYRQFDHSTARSYDPLSLERIEAHAQNEIYRILLASAPELLLLHERESIERSSSARPAAPGPNRSLLSPRRGGIEDLVFAKLTSVGATLEQITEEVEAREKLHERLLYELDHEICVQGEALLQVAPHGSSPFTVGDSRRRSALEADLARLKGEKRHEDVAVWKDLASLKKEFRELLREYEAEKHRQQVMRG